MKYYWRCEVETAGRRGQLTKQQGNLLRGVVEAPCYMTGSVQIGSIVFPKRNQGRGPGLNSETTESNLQSGWRLINN
jgi:hypothetical protein